MQICPRNFLNFLDSKPSDSQILSYIDIYEVVDGDIFESPIDRCLRITSDLNSAISLLVDERLARMPEPHNKRYVDIISFRSKAFKNKIDVSHVAGKPNEELYTYFNWLRMYHQYYNAMYIAQHLEISFEFLIRKQSIPITAELKQELRSKSIDILSYDHCGSWKKETRDVVMINLQETLKGLVRAFLASMPKVGIAEPAAAIPIPPYCIYYSDGSVNTGDLPAPAPASRP